MNSRKREACIFSHIELPIPLNVLAKSVFSMKFILLLKTKPNLIINTFILITYFGLRNNVNIQAITYTLTTFNNIFSIFLPFEIVILHKFVH